MDIEKKRAEIDEIDSYLTKLFLRRMQICGEIGHYKKEKVQSVREKFGG